MLTTGRRELPLIRLLPRRLLTTSNSILRSTRPTARTIAGTVSPSAALCFAAVGADLLI